MKKKDVCLLISFILGVVYLIVISLGMLVMSARAGIVDQYRGTIIGAGIIMLIPHYLCVFLAIIFNGLGYFLNKKGFALTGAIFYTVSIICMPLYILFVLAQTILSYVGYARLSNSKE